MELDGFVPPPEGVTLNSRPKSILLTSTGPNTKPTADVLA